MLQVFEGNGKYCSNILILIIYRQCLNFWNNILSTFVKFVLAFPMLQVSSSYSHKHKKWLRRIKVPPKNKCVKRVAQPRVITQTCGQFFKTLNSASGFLWRLQNLNRLFGWVFESRGHSYWNEKHTYLPTYKSGTESWKAKLHISTFYSEIFHSA